MSKEWYVIRVQSGREEKVRRSLERRIKAAGAEETLSRVIVPTETVSEIKGGKKRVTKKMTRKRTTKKKGLSKKK